MLFVQHLDFIGGRSRTRTYDPLIKRQMAPCLLAPELAPDHEGPIGKARHTPRNKVEKIVEILKRPDRPRLQETVARALANRRLQPLSHVSGQVIQLIN
jgi:hypothetical protein